MTLFSFDYEEGDAMSVALFVEGAQLVDAVGNLRDIDIGSKGLRVNNVALH